MPAPEAVTFGGVQRTGPIVAGEIGSIWVLGADGTLIETLPSELDLSTIPTSDPLISGLPWCDPSTGVLMRSFGMLPYSPSFDFSDSRNSMYMPLRG